jgi:Tol biopolymer transport system component
VVFDRSVSTSSPFDVWLLDLERRVTSRFTFQSCNVPVWSPDGRTVVFAMVGNGLVDLGQRPSNMSTSEQILLKLNAPPILFPSDWSSDGRYLAYYRTDPKTQLDLWILPLFGDRKPFPFARSEFNESQGQFSPDGKWLAYASDEGGTPQIYVQSFPAPGGKWQVSTAGGSQPRWRRDGKELFYVALDRKLMAVPVKTGAAFEAETPRALFETTLPTTPLRQVYAAAPDGQRFLLAGPVEAASLPMTIVENWTAALKK